MAGQQTIVAHFDLDAFFVSVECLLDPSLKGLPLIVGGHAERGVVAACSYEARKYGIHSAMPMRTAMKLCPHAKVLSGNRSEYSRYSRIVTGIISAKAPVMEKASIDEFYIDLTGMDRFFQPFEWTIALREEIMNETGLPISFALASNKLVAKIATDEAKPNGYLHVPFGMEAAFLAPLKVTKIPGVGEKTGAILMSMGIKTIGDLAARKREEMEERLGQYGLELLEKSRGIYHGTVEPFHEAKSVSTENTFDENISDIEYLLAELTRMTEKVAHELRKENKLSGCVTVKIRYHDFDTKSRQTTIPYTVFDDELIPVVRDLFHKLYSKGNAVRLIGVRLSDLTNEAMQTSLFSDPEKKSGLYRAIDEVKTKFGKNSITKARGI